MSTRRCGAASRSGASATSGTRTGCYTDRQKELRATLIELCEQEMRANAKRSDDELLFPRRNLELLGEHGFLALTVPEEYGGLGENHVAYSMVCETIARYGCASTAMCYVMHMGAVNAIMLRADAGADRQVHPAAEQRQDRDALLLRPGDRLALLVSDLVGRRAVERRLPGAQEGVLDDVRRLRRLLRRADDEPGLHRLRRPVGVRDRRRARAVAAVAVGRARAARQPVGPDRGRRTSRSPATSSSGRSATAPSSNDESVDPWFLARLVVGVERHRARRDRHREAAHDAQAPRRRRHARRRLPDDPGLRRRGRHGHERVPALRAVGRAGDGQRDRQQHARPRARRARPRRASCTGRGRSSSRRRRTSRTSSTRCCTRAAGRATSATWSSSATCAMRRPAG